MNQVNSSPERMLADDPVANIPKHANAQEVAQAFAARRGESLQAYRSRVLARIRELAGARTEHCIYLYELDEVTELLESNSDVRTHVRTCEFCRDTVALLKPDERLEGDFVKRAIDEIRRDASKLMDKAAKASDRQAVG